MNDFEQQRRELGLNCSVLISDFHYFSNLDSYIELIENYLHYIETCGVKCLPRPYAIVSGSGKP